MSLRSFCGGKLYGDKLVRLIYVDEAGIGDPKLEPFVVVTGIIVHGDYQLDNLVRSLEKLRKKHLPAEHLDDFVLHAKELFNGGGKLFGRINNPDWPIEKRLKIADDLAAIPKDLNLVIAHGSIERAKFQESFKFQENANEGEKTLIAQASSFLICAARIDCWMRLHAKDENCIIIHEDNHVARSLIVKAQNATQNQRFADSMEGNAAKIFYPFRHLREDPAFQPKKPAHPLEMADFCAYVYKKILMDKNDERYLRFFNPMRGQLATFS